MLVNAGETEYIAQSVLHVYRASGAGQAGLTMFGIVWLRRGILVDKDTSVLPSEADAIAAAESRARFVAKSHPGREPDSFRLTDATGKMVPPKVWLEFGVARSPVT